MFKKLALILALAPGAAPANSQPVSIVTIGVQPVQHYATMAGSWSFIAKCPLATTIGTASIQMTSKR